MGKYAWALLLILAILCGCGYPAQAHGSGIVAIVSFGPGTPKPGELTTVTIKLVDAYGGPLAGMKTRAVVSSQAKPLPQPEPLKETEPGIYTGDLPFPTPGPAFFSMEADLPDGLWYALLPFSTDDVPRMMLNLMRADNGTTAPPPQPVAPPSAGWLPKVSWLVMAAGLGIALYGVVVARRR